MQTRIVPILVTAVAFGLVFACTVKTESPNNNSGDGGSSGTSSGTSGTSSGSTSGDSGTKTGDPEVCKATADIDKCETCCGISEEVLEPLDGTYITCVCDEKCATECASTYCSENGGEPNQACKECLDREEPGCDEKSKTECDKNPKCKAFLSCANAACADKLPDERDGG